MISRPGYVSRLRTAIGRSPVTALLGPRQSGKTTLAREIAREWQSTFFDLESPQDERRLQNPEFVLESLSGLVVIDEIQFKPELFSVLRVLADRDGSPARFLILGSASPYLRDGASDSLAGRIEFVDLSGFRIEEVGRENLLQLWVRGGFPRSYVAGSDEDSFVWREDFIRTFLQRDLAQFGVRTPATVMRRFWTMLAHYHGQTWNSSELGRALGQSDKTVRSYLDTLTGAYMIRQLPPWFENIAKRQVKAPKVYLRDTGLLHALLMLHNLHELTGHPKVGASWEGFALEHVLHILDVADAFFWSVHGGSEIDLLVFDHGRRVGFEFKYSQAPTVTRSMRNAAETLKLDSLWVIIPGTAFYPVEHNLFVCSLSEFPLRWIEHG
ncbi:MAG: ATP-binding protein [Alkalispirochaeta sp.]